MRRIRTPASSRRTPSRAARDADVPFWRCGGRRGSRSPATAGPRSATRGRRCARSGPAPRRVFLALGRQELAPFAQAPQHHYLVRSVDPVDPPLPLPHATYVTGRGPFSEADDRALHDRRTASTSSSPRTAAAPRPTARSRAARALGIAVDHAAPAAAAARRRAVETVDEPWRGSIMRSTSAAARGV